MDSTICIVVVFVAGPLETLEGSKNLRVKKERETEKVVENEKKSEVRCLTCKCIP